MPEETIWSFLEQLVDHLLALEKRGLYHGDLSPGNIYVDSGKLTVATPLFYTYYNDGYQLMLADSNYRTCLSPELLEEVKVSNHAPEHNPHKSDVFSMGISVLSLVLGVEFDVFYDFEAMQVREYVLRTRLVDLMKMGYSKKLFWLLK